MRIRVIDIETTGEELQPDHGVCEVGYCDVLYEGNAWRVGTGNWMLTHPGRSIPPETSAVHHIIDEDVAACPNWRDVLPRFLFENSGDSIVAFTAHSAAFERQFITDEMAGGLPWICTLKVAYRMWKEAPSHSNQGLRYWRNPVGINRELTMPTHRAGPDAYVTAFHLRDMLNAPKVEIEHLVKVSSRPALLPHLRFGKHKGTPWTEVPRDYLEWLCNQADMSEDVRYTAEHYLAPERK